MEILHTPSAQLRTHTNPIHACSHLCHGMSKLFTVRSVPWRKGLSVLHHCLIWAAPPQLSLQPSLCVPCYVNTHALMLVVHHKAKCFLTSFLRLRVFLCQYTVSICICGVPVWACDVNKLYLLFIFIFIF